MRSAQKRSTSRIDANPVAATRSVKAISPPDQPHRPHGPDISRGTGASPGRRQATGSTAAQDMSPLMGSQIGESFDPSWQLKATKRESSRAVPDFTAMLSPLPLGGATQAASPMKS